MKVAYVSAFDPVQSIGGASNTAATWLTDLRARGETVDVVCRGEADETIHGADGRVIRLEGLRPRAKLEAVFANTDYDVALIQDLWADVALEAAEAAGVPTVLSLTTTHADEAVISSFAPTRFVANSRYTQQWIASVWGRDSTLVYPHVDFEFYTAPEGPANAVSMINPIEMKGGGIFRAVAAQCPGRDFLAKGGWYSFRNDDFSWDLDAIRMQANAFYGAPLEIPDEELERNAPTDASFEDCENVTFTREPGILEVYAKTRVLVVPSQWAETFGRVVLEAMWNGIPVVASHRGGLPEACGGAGLLVDDYEDPAAWVTALERLDDPEVYDAFAQRGRRRAEDYRLNQPDRIDALEGVLADAGASG